MFSVKSLLSLLYSKVSNKLRTLLYAFAISPLFYMPNATADIALLIHGFNAHALTWEQSGVNQYLHQHGWTYQGILIDQGHSVVLQPSNISLQPSGLNTPLGEQNNKHKLYTVNLASRAPIEHQSHQLTKMILWLNQIHPTEVIYLVGHSAGGLVARYTLVVLFQQQPHKQQPKQIAGLITIATPHLGTFRAAQATDAIEEPLFCPGPGWRFMQSIFAGDEYDLARKSKKLLYELHPGRPYNLIYWLNQQAHPKIPYYSIVRASGDFLVPGYSQDMNNIPALKNQSHIMMNHSEHYLTSQDAVTIFSILTFLSHNS